ncbi:hypothetical protein VFPPC_15074 [Pochonia chlamydosporia 170]|uniref:Uncharacterized protein n=1 Tax=Pochonia chlamydosporia 170 TaxID=1380566 RepID=A0A179G3U6_METCM|nr:hypothetical protein VFPPC_15074 [Pochonia chlamydosporia 170]OAQ72170.1 hypothetical protein VFPPC_15074 [Pochonia chlamydosporia 170]
MSRLHTLSTGDTMAEAEAEAEAAVKVAPSHIILGPVEQSQLTGREPYHFQVDR